MRWSRRLVSALQWGTVASMTSLAVALLGGSEAFARPSSLLGPVVAGAAVFAPGHLVLAWLLSPRRKESGASSQAISVAVGCFAVLVACSWPILHWIRHSTGGLAGRQLAVTAALLAASIFGASAAVGLALGASVPRRLRPLATLPPAVAPVAAAILLFWCWTQMQVVEGVRSAASVLLTLGCLLAVAAATALAAWLSRRFGPAPASVITTAVACLPVALTAWPPADSRLSAGPAPSEPRCVVLLTVDTLRSDAVSALDPAAPETPAIDELFGDSVVFTEARSAAPWTKPSMASVLTGLPPLVHRVNKKESVLPSRLVTLAEHLREAGYVTGAVGRNYFLSPNFGFEQGFGDYDFFPRVRELIGEAPGGAVLRGLLPDEFPGEGTPEVLTDRALRWIDRHAETAFFFWLHYFDPHTPFSPQPAYLSGEPPSGRVGASFDRNVELRSGELTLDPREKAWLETLYLAEVRQVDDQIARLLRRLKDLDLYDSCLIAFTSDHGEEFWEHGRFEHGHTLYDEVLRIPLAIKPPDRAGRRDVPVPVNNASLTPTILDLLGRPLHREEIFEPSLRPWIEDAADRPQPPQPVMTGMLYFEPRMALLFRGLKAIRETESGRARIFDLQADPAEEAPLPAVEPLLLGELEGALEERIVAAEERRRALGLGEDDEEAEISPEGLRELKAVGYLQ